MIIRITTGIPIEGGTPHVHTVLDDAWSTFSTPHSPMIPPAEALESLYELVMEQEESKMVFLMVSPPEYPNSPT